MTKPTETEPEDKVMTSIFTEGVLRKVKDFLEEEMYCDVTLVSNPGDFKIKAHKLILSAASEYFHKMFCTPFKESNENHAELHVDGESLKSVIGYIYTASIELTPETVEDVLRAASLFQIATLVTICSDFMAKQLDSTNCLGINLFAEKYNLEELSKLSEDFVCVHFMEILEEEEFFKLDVDRLSRILSNDNLRLFSEEDVFRSLSSWVYHDRPEREKHMLKLLHQVRFQLLNPDYILDEILETNENRECRELIHKSLIWHSLPESRRLKYAEKQTTRRTRTDMLVAITGWSGNDSSLKVGLRYSKASKWIYKSWPGLPVGLSKFASVSFEDKLIIAGGVLKDTQEVTNSVHCLDLKTLKWTSLAPLLTPRHSFKMTVIDGCVFAAGGIQDGEWIGTIDRWNSDTCSKQWTTLDYIPEVPYDFKTDFNNFHFCSCESVIHYLFIRGDNSWNSYDFTPYFDEKGSIHKIYPKLPQSNILGVFKMYDDTFLLISREFSSTYHFEYPFQFKLVIVSESVFDKPISEECNKILFLDSRSIIAYGTNFFEQYDRDRDENMWVRRPMPKFKNDDEDEVVVVSIS